MQKISTDEVIPLSQYERERDAFRRRVIAHKKSRRVLLGPEMSLLFEDRLTVLCQILEMVRAERIVRPEAIAEEVSVYNDLIPPDGAVLATLMIEVAAPARRAVLQQDLLGLENHLRFELGDRVVHGTFDPKGLFEDQISVVQFVTFAVGIEAGLVLRDLSVPARLVCSHPRYGYAVELDALCRQQLATDLGVLPG